MAITAEFLKTTLSGDGDVDAKVNAIMTEYTVDVTGLKTNKQAILEEKTELEKKLKALETEKSTFDAKIKEYEDKIKKAGTEDAKAFYEAELKKLTDGHAATLKALQDERDSAIATSARYIANDEFATAIKDLNLVPELKDDLRDVLYARNKFEVKNIEGEKKYLNAESRTVKDVLETYLKTDAGKKYVLNGSSGSGASGSRGSGTNPTKPWKEMSLGEQTKLMRSNPDLARQLQNAGKE